MQREKDTLHYGGKQIKLGIVPKLLLGILCPLIISMVLVTIFLGMRGSAIVNDIMNDQLNAQANEAANMADSFFNHYYGVAECLAATQIVRDTTDSTGSFTDHTLYPSLLETLRLIQQRDSENVSTVWVVNLQTGESIQNDGMLYTAQDFDYSTRSWYQLVSSKQDTIITEVFTGTNGEVISVASPVYANNTLVGIVGLDLNIARLKTLLGDVKIGDTGYVTVYDVNSQIIYHPDQSVVDTNAADAGYSTNMRNAILNKEDSDAMLYTRNGTQYYGSTSPIGDTGYVVLGVMPVAEYTSQTTAILRVLVIGVTSCVLLMTIIGVFIAISITRPLKRLNAAVSKLSDGELNVAVDVHTHDEVAEVGAGVARIVERLKEYILYIDEISAVLNQIGNGNLMFTLQQNYVGEFAKVKSALMNIRSTLTETLTSIAHSADQVNAGAEQIASGAQALAQGATEQASSVQELSSAVQDLSTQATAEAEKAVEAGQFLEQIRDAVDKSNTQMDTMRKAMTDISVQSAAIRGIIKTIDDIAFQTNILALNAAVEAARAGTAGKGFAVVADEVRSLAGKSAEAAKKTNELIENSVQAVEHGEELTKQTAESLAVVADGTRQVAETIDTVARAYREQAGRLSEIAKGVDQIADVVQTNSATAEQSAAASQELSGQANMMHQQIAHFKLGQDYSERPAPAAPQPSKTERSERYAASSKY